MRETERDRGPDRDMSNILILMKHMCRGNLIFPLECQQPSLVMEHNVVMSSLGNLPDFHAS